MRRALSRRAPWTTFRPTPPQPKTATVMPGWAAGLLITAPVPVVTQHPIRAATSIGTSPGTGWHAC